MHYAQIKNGRQNGVAVILVLFPNRTICYSCDSSTINQTHAPVVMHCGRGTGIKLFYSVTRHSTFSAKLGQFATPGSNCSS